MQITGRCLGRESAPEGSGEQPLHRPGHSGRQLDGRTGAEAQAVAAELQLGAPGSCSLLCETPVCDSHCLQSLGLFLPSFSSFSAKH